jgi:hypothetical protein
MRREKTDERTDIRKMRYPVSVEQMHEAVMDGG